MYLTLFDSLFFSRYVKSTKVEGVRRWRGRRGGLDTCYLLLATSTLLERVLQTSVDRQGPQATVRDGEIEMGDCSGIP